MRFGRFLSVAICLVVASSVVLSGCAGVCGVKDTGVKEEGVTLEYRMDGGEAVSYRQKSEMLQTMEVQGQSIPVESSEELEFSILSDGKDGEHLKLGVTVDGLSVVATSPQGNLDAKVAGVVGKSFDMTLSKLGEEGSLPDSETLIYTIEPQGDRSLIPIFGVMFPDLPDHPVGVGGSWPAILTMTDDTGGTETMLVLEAVNTLEGFEMFGGYDCAKISSVLTGTIDASGKQEGADWSLSSTTEGTGVWYFAHKEGIVVSDITKGTADGAIIVDAPSGEVQIPVSREYVMTLELIK